MIKAMKYREVAKLLHEAGFVRSEGGGTMRSGPPPARFDRSSSPRRERFPLALCATF